MFNDPSFKIIGDEIHWQGYKIASINEQDKRIPYALIDKFKKNLIDNAPKSKICPECGVDYD